MTSLGTSSTGSTNVAGLRRSDGTSFSGSPAGGTQSVHKFEVESDIGTEPVTSIAFYLRTRLLLTALKRKSRWKQPDLRYGLYTVSNKASIFEFSD
jgi:hypothetical protein